MTAGSITNFQSDGNPLTVTLAEIIRLTKARRCGKRWRGRCPGPLHKHGNRHHPALSIWIDDDGRIALNCFTGCTRRDICAALGIPVSALSRPHTAQAQRALAEQHTAEERREIERRTLTRQIERWESLERSLARELVEAPVNAITSEKTRSLHRVFDKVRDLEIEKGRYERQH